MPQTLPGRVVNELVEIAVGSVSLAGLLNVPDEARGVVVFAHGSGSSRLSPRNQFVASVLQEGRFGTLLMDLLTPREERRDAHGASLRFDIDLLAQRLIGAARWLASTPVTQDLWLGFFGASTGAGAALVAAAARPERVRAVVSRSGRPDLAESALERVMAPTLLLVGAHDLPVIDMSLDALDRLRCVKKVQIIPDAGHGFEEPGALSQVAALALEWFERYLGPSR